MKSLRSAIFAALGALFFSPTSLSEKYTYSSLSRNSFEAQELSSISVFHLSCFDSLHKVSERLSVKLLIESWWHKGATAMQSTTNRGGTFLQFFHDLPQSLFAKFLQDIQCCLPESGNEVQWTGKWTVKKSIMSTNSPVTGGRADTTRSVGWGVALL